MTSGQSMFGFFGACHGTFLAAVFSIVIWYIVDQKNSRSLSFFGFSSSRDVLLFEVPSFHPGWLVAIVTQVLIIGTSLPATQNYRMAH